MTSLIDLRPPAPCPTPFNLTAHVLRHAEDTPDKIALAILRQSGAERWSYEKLARTVYGLAGALRAKGLSAGDQILMRLGNTVEFPLVYLAAIAADLVPIPTSAQLTEPEITKMTAALAPKLIIAAEDVALPLPLPCPVIASNTLLDLATHAPLAPVMGDPDRPAYVIFTSGTSGTPRAVEHAHRAIWARQMMVSGWYDLQSTDRVLHAGAFNWTYTLGTGLMDPWAAGATALIPDKGLTAAQLPLLLKRYDATLFAAAPGVYRQMLRAPILPMPKLRHGLSAGEKMPAALHRQWEEATGTRIHEAFGMSECSTFLSGHPARPTPPEALGYVQPGRRVALVDEKCEVVAKGNRGQIVVDARDPGLMLSYCGAPDETAARYSADGQWFLTGDMARMDDSGAFFYEGRADDMMNAGGFRVSPLEVEAALMEHPEIHEVAATEVTVKADTTVIAAFYTAQSALDVEALKTFAETLLARYKTPRLYIHCPELPRSANGKLLRKQLRADYEAAYDPT